MNTTDRHIAERILAGDTDSIAELMERYARRVFALIVRIVDTPDDAEELTQDVFLKICSSIGSFDWRSSLPSWIYRIACNAAISHSRRSRPERIAVDDEVLARVPDDAPGALLGSDDPRLAALPEALDALTPAERALITLHYYEGIPLREAAPMLGISEANAKVRLMRTRKKLYVLITDFSRKYE